MISRVKWMQGKYGLMVHYLLPRVWNPDGTQYADSEAAVETFDVPRFMAEFEATGAEWLIFTFGQNTGHYCSPNAVIDAYAGPGHCTRRDLMMELAIELERRGKKLIGYLPCEVNANTTMHAGFQWSLQPGTAQLAFQDRYLEAVRFWAKKFGSRLAGWWFDGCYPWEAFPNRFMQWEAWFAAARAGNPEAAVTFNDGSFCVGATRSIRPGFDYFAGEVTMLHDGHVRLGNEFKSFRPDGAALPDDDCLWHALAPIDALWMHRAELGEWLPPGHRFEVAKSGMEAPIYSDAELLTLRDDFCGQGGALTLNAGIFMNGTLGPETLAQLRRLNRN